MKTLLFFALFVSSVALAQNGVCKPGIDCTVRSAYATGGSSATGAYCTRGPNADWFWNTGTSVSTLGWTTTNTRCSSAGTALINMSVNETVVSAHSTGGWRAGSAGFQGGAGSATVPSFTFTSDSNTGLYSVGADQIGVTTGGVRGFNFSATPGYLEGTTSTPKLILDGITGASLAYSVSSVAVASNVVIINAGTSGVKMTPNGAATAWTSGTYFPAVLVDANDGRSFWTKAAPSAVNPPIDIGGNPHPVLQRHVFGLDMGFESNATPTFYPATPRVGGAAATVTVVDAAVATTQAIGANPLTFDARGSVTGAVAGSISSVITSLFIRRATQSPRWCQKVSMSTGANIRVWAGLASALPGSTDNPANSALSFRYSTTATDTKWMACYANGVSTTCVDTGVAPAVTTATFDTLCIDCIEGGTTACTWWVNGIAKVRQTTGLAAGYPLAPYYSVEARAAAAVTLNAGNSSVELY